MITKKVVMETERYISQSTKEHQERSIMMLIEGQMSFCVVYYSHS